MKIGIAKISQNGTRFAHDYNPGELDLNSPDIEFKKPLHADVYCYKISNTVSLEIDLEAEYDAKCSRCLKFVARPVKKKIKLSYMIKPNDSFIDCTEDVREQVMLDYPMKSLCDDGCLGLCAKCGKDLNQKKCSCSN